MEPVAGRGGELFGVVQVREFRVEAVTEHTRRHDERPRTGTAAGLVDARDGTQPPPGERGLQREPAVPAGHPRPGGQQAVPSRALGTCPGHPALMSGEETVPIRSNGRMIACTLPMMFSAGTVPWCSSPMWKRESAELPRLSPITQ